QIPAGEVARALVGTRGLDAVPADQVERLLADRAPPEERTPRHRGLPVGLEDRVLRNAERGRDAGSEPVLGHVRDPGGDRDARIAGPERPPLDPNGPGARSPHSRDHLRELPLAVSGHARNAEDLATADDQ